MSLKDRANEKSAEDSQAIADLKLQHENERLQEEQRTSNAVAKDMKERTQEAFVNEENALNTL